MSLRPLLTAMTIGLITLLSGSLSLAAGGFSGSGGGSGVICFATRDLADEADVWLKANKTLPDSLLQKGELRVLEAWEMKQLGFSPVQPRAGEAWPELLHAVEELLRADFPIFMYRLDQVGDWAKIQSWKNVTEVPLLEDAQPIRPIPRDLCRRVQIVVRDSEGNNRLDEGPLTHHPRVKVTFIQSYFDRLPESDKAMLVFHEKIYMLAQGVGRNSSDRVRAIVRIFFDSSVDRMRGRPGMIILNDAHYTIKEQLILILGDYIQFFSSQDPSPSARPFSSRHHFDTFIALNRRLYKRAEGCRDKMEWLKCVDSVANPGLIQNELTPEDAFVYRAFHELERLRGCYWRDAVGECRQQPSLPALNADAVMDPVGKDSKHFEMAMRGFCSEMQQVNMIPELRVFEEKSLHYCAQWMNANRGIRR